MICITLTGNPREEGKIPAGQRLYPFSLQLPQNLPSSYEGGIGFVRYAASCNVDVPWGFDIDTKRMFSIMSVYDLNQVPNAMASYKLKSLIMQGCTQGIIFS